MLFLLLRYFFCVGDARIYESSGFVDFTDHVYLYSESTNVRCIKVVLTVDFIALAVGFHAYPPQAPQVKTENTFLQIESWER